jgi:hypothetical protein
MLFLSVNAPTWEPLIASQNFKWDHRGGVRAVCGRLQNFETDSVATGTYIVITYYNVKQKDLNLLNKFPHGMNNSLPGPAHFTIQDSGTKG